MKIVKKKIEELKSAFANAIANASDESLFLGLHPGSKIFTMVLT